MGALRVQTSISRSPPDLDGSESKDWNLDFKEGCDEKMDVCPVRPSPATVTFLRSLEEVKHKVKDLEVKKKRGIRDITYALNYLLENLYIDNWDLIRLTVNRKETNGGERSSGFACKRRRILLEQNKRGFQDQRRAL